MHPSTQLATLLSSSIILWSFPNVAAAACPTEFACLVLISSLKWGGHSLHINARRATTTARIGSEEMETEEEEIETIL